VQSLVKDIFTPFIGLLVGNIDFSNIFFTLKGPHYATLAEAQKAGSPTVNVGLFLNAVIQFLIVGLVIFWVVKLLTKMHVREEKKEAAAPTTSELLLTEIRDLLARPRDLPGEAPALPPSITV
jgi:large conductance mechanosensitive channel